MQAQLTIIRPCQLVALIASSTGHHPYSVYLYLVQKLPLGANYLTPEQMLDLLNGYGATLPVDYCLAGGYLYL